MYKEIQQSEVERLVREAAGGDSSAFEALVAHYCGMVYAISFARLRNRETAEDLVQEVFLRIHLNLGKLSEPRHFGTWASRIARNLSDDWAKREQRKSGLIAMVPVNEPAAL